MQTQNPSLAMLNGLADPSSSEITGYLQTLKAWAKPTYSGYRVSTLLRTTEDEWIPGVNYEFDRHRSICAEQAAIALARQSGASGIESLYVTEWPCGVCRQFLWDVASPELTITNVTCGESTTLGELLPHAFGLETKSDFWASNLCPQEQWTQHDANTLLRMTLESSVAPLTRTQGAVLIQSSDNKNYCGPLLENTAFTPSLSPMHTALVALLAARQSPDENMFQRITAVYLGEPRHAALSYRDTTQVIMKALAPKATYDVISF